MAGWTQLENGSYSRQFGELTATTYKPRGDNRYWLHVVNQAGVEVLIGVSPFDHQNAEGYPRRWGEEEREETSPRPCPASPPPPGPLKRRRA